MLSRCTSVGRRHLKSCGNVKFYHEFVFRIDKSVPMVTVLPQEALPNSDPRDRFVFPQTHAGLYFCICLGISD